MDRFEWSDGLLAPAEMLVAQQPGVRVYDGEDKVKIMMCRNRQIFDNLSIFFFRGNKIFQGWGCRI